MLPLILHPPASFLVSPSVRFGETRKDHLWFPEMIHCRTLTEGACNKVSQGYYLYRHLVYQPHTQLGLPLWSSEYFLIPPPLTLRDWWYLSPKPNSQYLCGIQGVIMTDHCGFVELHFHKGFWAWGCGLSQAVELSVGWNTGSGFNHRHNRVLHLFKP